MSAGRCAEENSAECFAGPPKVKRYLGGMFKTFEHPNMTGGYCLGIVSIGKQRRREPRGCIEPRQASGLR